MRVPDAQELWRRFGVGDESAFAQLYSDHHHDVVRYCRSLLRDDEDAQDAAQGTWASVWTTADAAARDVPLRPWLFRIAHNEAISIVRRRRPHEVLADLDLPAPGDVAEDVELRERLATLRADLVNLPERQRVALLSRELGGLGHAEIGAALGVSAAAAKQTIYEARRALAEAESGRSMTCDLVQRAISDGDGRVRRSRRLGAHLRGCAGCRTFADAVGHRHRDLRLLFPAPAALGLLARAAAGVGGGGAAGAGVAAGGGGAVVAKVAVAAAVIAVAGVGGRHEPGRTQQGHDKRATVSRPIAAAPARRIGAVAASWSGPAQRRATLRTTSSTPSTPRKIVASRHRPANAAPAAAPAVAVPPRVVAPGPAVTAQPPGQAKKTDGPVPPGQARKADGAVPPGQAKKTDGAVPPGQAKKNEPAAAPTSAAAPDAAVPADVPPGQAKKLARDARP